MSPFVAVRRRARSVSLVLLVLLGTLGLGTVAQAHDMLVASDPAEGAVLEAPPESITLSFNNPPLEVGSAITVVDADGTTVAEGEGTVEGNDVVLALDTDLPAGALAVRWRVASSDGHPIEGVIPFDVVAPSEPATTEAAEPSETAEPATAEETTAPETTDAAEPTEEPAASGLPTAAKVAIAVAAVGGVAAVVVLAVRRQRTDRL